MDAYSTHQRLLLRAALNTTGPILELGCGWYSTLILHEVARRQDRLLISEDNDPAWLERVRAKFVTPEHIFRPLSRAGWREWWGLVFVDHGPPPELPRNSKGLLNALDRGQAVLDLMGNADVFVLHDTQPDVRWEYDWDKVLPLFKHQVTDEIVGVQTTVLSNSVDVTKWT